MNYIKELEAQLYSARGRLIEIEKEMEQLQKRCDELTVENMKLRAEKRALESRPDNIFDYQNNYMDKPKLPDVERKKTSEELHEDFLKLVKNGILG